MTFKNLLIIETFEFYFKINEKRSNNVLYNSVFKRVGIFKKLQK